MTELDEAMVKAVSDAIDDFTLRNFDCVLGTAVTIREAEKIVAAARSHSPVPAGYRLVPVEPTQEMLGAGKYAIKGCPSTFERDEADAAYRAMLSAAPTVKPTVVPAVPDDVREAVETVLRLEERRCGRKASRD